MTSRIPLAVSADGSVRVLRGIPRADIGSLICEGAAGDALFTVELLGHPYDGRLYALNRHALPRGAPRWQRWNQLTSRWEPADEDLLLALANVARGLFSLILTALLASCALCYWLRRRQWIRGVAVGLAIAALVCAAFYFVPIAWSGGYFDAVSLNHDGSVLGTASHHDRDTTVCVWDVSTGHGLTRIELTNVHADSLAFSPDSTKLEVRNGGAVILVWPLSAKSAQ